MWNEWEFQSGSLRVAADEDYFTGGILSVEIAEYTYFTYNTQRTFFLRTSMRIEESQSITATDLARNIAQTIDAVRMSRTTVLITKGAKVIAQLSPPPKTGLSVQGLIDLLRSLPGLTTRDSKQMADDVKKIRTAAKLADNPWD